MLCDQILERVPLLVKMGKYDVIKSCYRSVPPDMFVTLHTLVYSADRANIAELVSVRQQIIALYGPEFAHATEADANNINETIRENINLIMPETGRKVERLIDIAKEFGVNYVPTERSLKV